MAILVNNERRDVLERISIQKCLIIYIRSFLFNILVLLKRILKNLRDKVEKRLSLNDKFKFYSRFQYKRNDSSSSNFDAYDKPPGFLMDTNLGTHSFVKLKTCKLHYLEAGSGEKSALLLHGFPDCWLSWRFQIPELKNNYRVIVPDLKGFNDSEKPQHRSDYKPDQICEELKQFLDALNIEEVVIIGHNLGGLIGWILAAKYPRIVKKLVVVSAPHPNLFWDNIPSVSAINKSWYEFVQFPSIPENELSSNEDFIKNFFPHLSNNINCELLNDNTKAVTSHDLVDAYKYIFSREMDWTGPLNYYRNFYFYRVRQEVRIECPCLIITGNEDNFHRIENIIRSSDYCDRPTIKVIEKANHCPHQHSPAEFNKILISYLCGEKSLQMKKEKSVPGLVGRMMKLANPYQLAESGFQQYQQLSERLIKTY